MREDYKRWVISNFLVKEVMEINDADRMPMFDKLRRGKQARVGTQAKLVEALEAGLNQNKEIRRRKYNRS